MDFQEFWKKLQVELKRKKKFKTLTQKKKFMARIGYVKEKIVVLATPEQSQIQRGRIPYNEFKGVWNNAKKYSKETRFVNKSGRLASFTNNNGTKGKSKNLSYIVTLISHTVKNQDMD